MALGVAAVAAAVTLLLAQTAGPKPSFEVSSIKPSIPGDRSGRFITMQGGHQFVAKNYTVKRLVAAAYSVSLKAISGGPAWLDADLYDILAVTPGEVRPSLDEQMLMLQRLLTDRLSLAFHDEQRELPVYELSVAKGGAKLRESTAAPDENPVLVNRVFPDHVQLPARNATMGQFASMLQRAVLDRPVLDKTGLAGKYDFDLEWAADETQFDGKLPRVPENTQEPGLFAALQQQLGLRLEATKGPVAVLVIGSVQKPTVN
jgi:uncharacterized protein (TIGR03435 family)